MTRPPPTKLFFRVLKKRKKKKNSVRLWENNFLVREFVLKEGQLSPAHRSSRIEREIIRAFVCVCVCVCVRERTRGKSDIKKMCADVSRFFKRITISKF